MHRFSRSFHWQAVDLEPSDVPHNSFGSFEHIDESNLLRQTEFSVTQKQSRALVQALSLPLKDLQSVTRDKAGKQAAHSRSQSTSSSV